MKRFVVAFLAAGVLLLGASQRASAWTLEIEQARTDDGVTLRLLRLKNTGGTPILLSHGIGTNLQEFILPSRSFAGFLADQGYDVWCLNFRSTGRGVLASGGPSDHSFDDLVVLDMPAAVQRIRSKTNRRPFLIGHSLGGMASLAWLQGVTRQRVPVYDLGPFSIRRPRIVADRSLARQRAASIRGVVPIGSPARFTWPERVTVRTAHRVSYWDYNLLLTYLSWSPSANVGALLAPEVPTRSVGTIANDVLTRFPHAQALQGFLVRVIRAVGRTFLLAQLMRPNSTDPRVLTEGLRLAVDSLSAGILQQFMDGIRRGDMRERHTWDSGRRPYSYGDGISRVRAPLLWVAGRYDKLANEEGIALAFSQAGSSDKTHLLVDHGHIDLIIGDDAPRTVWRPVARWLAAH